MFLGTLIQYIDDCRELRLPTYVASKISAFSVDASSRYAVRMVLSSCWPARNLAQIDFILFGRWALRHSVHPCHGAGLGNRNETATAAAVGPAGPSDATTAGVGAVRSFSR